MKKMILLYHCENCREKFAEYKNRERKFCSQSCANMYNMQKRVLPIEKKLLKHDCKKCGKEFYADKNQKNRMYCSKSCSRKGIPIPRKNFEVSEETKRKIGLGNKGKIRSAEMIKKLSDAHKGLKWYPESLQKAHAARSIKPRPCEWCGELIKSRTRIRFCSMSCAKKSCMSIPENRVKMGLANKGRVWSKEIVLKRILHNKKMHNTKPELKMKEFLREANIDYKHQYRVDKINKPYVADFFLPNFNCIIEVDGDYWHTRGKNPKLDLERNEQMRENGFLVLRFWESDIMKLPELVQSFLDELVNIKNIRG